MIRLSIDAKATVKVGPFARGGKSRVRTKACDHDFKPVAQVTPVGIFLPASDELFIYEVTSKVTSDCLVDCIEQWWSAVQERLAHITTLVINLDNGPENHSRRTQFMQRMVEFVRQSGLRVRLAYYPPYHSKYNPIERCWGVLEVYWNGELLDSEAAVLGFAANMTYAGRHPQVERVSATYCSGVRRSSAERKLLEGRLARLPSLPKWSVTIAPPEPGEIILPC